MFCKFCKTPIVLEPRLASGPAAQLAAQLAMSRVPDRDQDSSGEDMHERLHFARVAEVELRRVQEEQHKEHEPRGEDLLGSTS